MDNLTHSLAGAALGAAGLRRLTPLATPTLVVAANAPDIDAFVYAVRDPYYALAFRRGITHGPLAMALLPFVVAGGILAWDRWVRRRRDPAAEPARAWPIIFLALIGGLTHPALDWMNTYGIRLLAPFSMEWFYGDALFIIDPWLWLALGAAVFLGLAPRGRALLAWTVLAAAASALVLATSLVPPAAKAAWVAGIAAITLMYRVTGLRRDAMAVGARHGTMDRMERSTPRVPRDATTTAARWALGIAVAYTLFMVVSDRAATRRVHEAARELGIGPIEAVMVAPVPADPFRGDVVVETPTAYHLGAFDWFGEPRVRIGEDSIPIAAPVPAGEAAARVADARNFLVWSRFPTFRIAESPDGYTVRIGDARYVGMGDGGLGGLVVRLDRELRPIER